MATAVRLSSTLSDAMLRLAPANLLLFDRNLICRYAAPLHDRLAGRPRAALVGLSADELFPPARNGLRTILEDACRDARPWHDPAYRFVEVSDGHRRDACWAIQVDPVETPKFQGVLVSWSDLERIDRERDALRREVDRLKAAVHERNAALTEVLSDIRNAITPIAGYLQVLTRRPQTFKDRSVGDVIADLVLPRIADVIDAADRLRQPPIFVKDAEGRRSTSDEPSRT